MSEPSHIDEVNEHISTIYGWFLRRAHIKFDLVYRGTQHGFSSEAFHKHLDGRAQLIFFVKSVGYNKVFGGYTEVPWGKPEKTKS